MPTELAFFVKGTLFDSPRSHSHVDPCHYKVNLILRNSPPGHRDPEEGWIFYQQVTALPKRGSGGRVVDRTPGNTDTLGSVREDRPKHSQRNEKGNLPDLLQKNTHP